MIIGIDAGALSVFDERLKVGVYRVAFNLLKGLGKIDKKNTYSLYSFVPIDRTLMESFGPRMVNRVLRPKRGWFSLRLPLELMLHPVDIFLGLSQGIPQSQARNIGFIYDLGFLHYPEAYPGSQRKLSRLTEDVVGRSDHIVSISHAVETDIKDRFHVSEKKITVAYPGVDATFSSTGTRYHGDRPYFLFVGALKRGKNVPGLLRGFAQFLKKCKKPYDLYLVGGEYWKDPEIDQEIMRLGLSSRVRKIGFIPDTELASYYRGAVALVSPSLYEGFCLPAAEAMACGCSVIASIAGAFPEIVGDSGILVGTKDVHGLARAMKLMAENITVRKSYSAKGLQRSKQFSWSRMAQTVYNLLHV